MGETLIRLSFLLGCLKSSYCCTCVNAEGIEAPATTQVERAQLMSSLWTNYFCHSKSKHSGNNRLSLDKMLLRVTAKQKMHTQSNFMPDTYRLHTPVTHFEQSSTYSEQLHVCRVLRFNNIR